MGKKRRILLAASGVAAVALVVWLLMPSPEPYYQGRSLSYWLRGYRVGNDRPHLVGLSPPTREQADEAIRQMGTKAIPSLLRVLRSPNSALADRVWELRHEEHFHMVLAAFGALGSQASNAVPGLISIFESDPSPIPQQAVPVVLGQIGPAAEQAVPVLLRGIAHTNELVRNNAAYALGQIHAQPKLVVPALIKCLNDPEALVRASAARTLGAFGKDASSAVPALLQLRRKEAINHGPANRTLWPRPAGWFVSTSWNIPSDSNPDVFGSAMEALNIIDPGAVAGAGLK